MFEEKIEEKEETVLKHKSNYFSVPLAIIIAGVMIAGVVIYSNNKKTNLAGEVQKPIVKQGQTEDASKVYEVNIDDDAVKGNLDAKITIIEFSDYQCSYCAKAEATLKKVFETYGDKVKLVYRDYPLDFHQNAQKAAQASECAKEQGKFWEYHDLLFEHQNQWSEGNGAEFKKYAEDLKLDAAQFNQCLDSGKYKNEVKKDLTDGEAAGVSGTPAFFINGRLLSGAQPFSEFKKIIDEELAKS
ncbi:MAG: DsbA family protein [Patescibacteria group bacterium]